MGQLSLRVQISFQFSWVLGVLLGKTNFFLLLFGKEQKHFLLLYFVTHSKSPTLKSNYDGISQKSENTQNKKTLPHRRKVLNRMLSYGKTKLCFTQVKTTGLTRISRAMSGSDISAETSGRRPSALRYFPLGSKRLSEVFHLFIICFVN